MNFGLKSLVGLIALAATAGADTPPDYNQHISPIFKQYCLGCHNAKDAEGKLVLENYESRLKGGEGGAVLLPGKSDQSRLVLMLEGKIEPVMPPEDNERPKAEEIALVRAWVDAGAKSPSGQPPDPTMLVTPKVELLAPARKVINAAAVSPDGKLAALAGYREVRLVDTASRATLRTLAGHRGSVADVAFSSDGTKLISAAGEPGLFGELKLWNVADGALVRTIVGHRDSLYAAAISADGKLIATGGYDQDIKLWDAATGQEVRTITGHNGAVFDLAFSPNGKLLASASADRTVKLWDAATGNRLDTFGQPLKEQYAVVFSPDGRRVAAGGVDNRIRVWNLSDSAKEGTNPLAITRFAHEGAIIELAWSRDGKTLASSAEDRTVRVWNADQVIERLSLVAQPDWPAALALAADNKTLLVGRLDGSFAFYDDTNGQVILPPKPELAALWPRGLQRGTTTRVKLTGKYLVGRPSQAVKDPVHDGLEARPTNGLAGTLRIEFNHPKLQGKVVSAETERADETWVEITPAADLPRGSYQVGIVTEGGKSGSMPIEVDDLPQVAETEENNSPKNAAVVALPAGIWGTLAARGDVDHVAFEAKAGQTIVCELAAKSLGSALDGVLTLLDPAGEVVAGNNDFDGRQDPLVAYTVPADGRYTVRISDLALTGSAKHFYRLSIGELPYVTACFPVGVPANQEAEIELIGYNVPPGTRLKLPAGPPGDRPVPIDTNRFRVGRPLNVLASAASELVEAEPNDAADKATPIAVPGSVNGRIASAGDVDLFRFEAKAGQTWMIETEGERRGSPIDTRLDVLDAKGMPVLRLLLQAVRDSYLEFRGIDSNSGGLRPKNWEEMELNEFMYVQGEVCRVFRMPQGPDSELAFYQLGGRRRNYFDTSPTSHALGDSCYTVEPHRPGEKLVPNGLPVFPLYYANDDDMERKLGRDSRLTCTAPADGAYLVRVSDVRGFSGDRFVYRLTVRGPKPDFEVRLADVNPTVARGSGRRLSFSVDRHDGFDDDVTIDVAGLPAGFAISTPVVIQAGHVEARAVLNAMADAAQPPPEAWQHVKIAAKAQIAGQTVTKEVNGLGQVKLADKPNLIVRLEPADLTIAPGTTITATLKVDRNGFKDRVQFDVDNLPHGVIVDNIGLNGVLIPEGQDERQIFLTCARWVPDTDRKFHALANNAGGQASQPVTLHVRRTGPLAKK
ncbi:MAG TPA: pre-peptidase C-terminal domain-containing protein [Pirellulales bacterium]|nr:pre-peptidase C-terminal domain-containing protein [Pirellulales bacterium]